MLKILYIASLIFCFSAKAQEQQAENQEKWISCFLINEHPHERHNDCTEFNLKDLDYTMTYYTSRSKAMIRFKVYNNTFDQILSFACTKIEEGRKCKSWWDNL